MGFNSAFKGLMELFTDTGKLKLFFFTNRDVQCVHHKFHGTHRYDIQRLMGDHLISAYKDTQFQ